MKFHIISFWNRMYGLQNVRLPRFFDVFPADLLKSASLPRRIKCLDSMKTIPTVHGSGVQPVKEREKENLTVKVKWV